MAESPRKKDRENKKRKSKQEKAQKMRERKESAQKGKSLDEMMAYIDEDGNISETPPDPKKRKEVKLEDIAITVQDQRPPAVESEERSGKVTFFDPGKGFGFIRDNVSQQSIFVHNSNLSVNIKENDKVTFEVEIGHRGPFAVNVKLK